MTLGLAAKSLKRGLGGLMFQASKRLRTSVYDWRWRWVEAAHPERWCREAHRHRWIFVMGCNNSGTTLLVRLLVRHPEILRLSNTYEGDSLSAELPKPRAYGVPRLWTERLEVFRWTEADDPVDTARLYFDWVARLRKPDRPFVLEKSPPNALRSRWLQKAFPDSYFIGIVRNGYAVAEGIHRRIGYSIDRCARHWNTTNSIMIEDSVYLRRFLLVRYEHLVEEPYQTLQHLAEFLKVDSKPLQDEIDSEWDIHNMDEAPSKLQNFNGKSLTRLSPAEIEVVRRKAANMLEYFGYTPTQGV